ncbi:twin-arginine translocase TatA/TatE family subunit [bacterium]|nr:twin-arginine translocase TatA/TatE family subunit [bacterium]
MNLGVGEIAVVVLVVMLLFGGKRLPDTARQLGRGISELRRSYLEVKRDIASSLSSTVSPTQKDTNAPNASLHPQPGDVKTKSSTDS